MATKSGTKDSDNVKVAVRCRPINETELRQGHTVVVKADEMHGTVTTSRSQGRHDETEKTFTFDTVFGPDSKQLDIYNATARPIVDSVIEGYNGTVFAYGQTGTGKTFTMEGNRSVPELAGIIPNSFAHVFGHIAKCEEDTTFLVRCSYLEIYNEDVRDLLDRDHTTKKEVKERPDVGVYVKDLKSFVVKNTDEMDKLMTIGNKNRAVGKTNMNEHSSRSHAIYTITLECSALGIDKQQHLRMGKLHLVDLAGSERQSKTGAAGERLVEATKINLSLSTLGNVISALVDGKRTHIPYRNSKLTRLLQDSLGGNSKTVMIANIGPADYNYDETLSALWYANRAKNIKNKARINEDPKDAMLREYQKEIELLRKQLADGGEGAEESESEDEAVVDSEGRKGKLRRKRSRGSMTPKKLMELQQELADKRKELEERRDMAEAERSQFEDEIKRRESELTNAQHEHDELENKMRSLESRLIVGGVNLLEKAKQQEQLLEKSANELAERQQQQERLQQKLAEKAAEKLEFEERYANLQEEAAGKTRKIKKVWSMLQATKRELEDLRSEYQREMETSLENIRELTRDIKLQSLAIDNFIPVEYQELIESHCVWNEEIEEWQLRGIAYTGNHMRKQPSPPIEKPTDFAQVEMANVYLSYGGAVNDRKPKMATSSSRVSTSGRPKTAKGTRSDRPPSSRQKRAPDGVSSHVSESFPTKRGLMTAQKHFA